MGTPDFAVRPLAALHRAGHEIVAVYSQPPRPKGRGQQVQNAPVHEYAATHGLAVYTPLSLKNPAAQAEFAALKPDVAIVAAYGLILPRAVLDAPRFGCLNIHASLLPRWRGASPIQRAILAGDSETGITIMQMDQGLDTGPMIEKRTIALDERSTVASVHDDLAALGAEMIVQIVEKLSASGQLTAKPQDDTQATYAPLLTKEDGIIDWARSAAEIGRQIRALNPWPGTWATIKGRRVKILAARPADSPRTGPEFMPCGDGNVLEILTLQPEGKKQMDVRAAINGGYL